MDEILNRLEVKLDKLDDRLDSVDITLTKQNLTLEHHVRRTDLAEEAINNIKTELEPLKRAHYIWGLIGKGVAALLPSAGLIGGLLKMLHKL